MKAFIVIFDSTRRLLHTSMTYQANYSTPIR